jgi:hypothetical protein
MSCLDWITNENVMKVLEERFAELFPHILDYNYTVSEDKKLDVTNSILQHYLQGKPLSIKTRKEITQVRFFQTKSVLTYYLFNDSAVSNSDDNFM